MDRAGDPQPERYPSAFAMPLVLYLVAGLLSFALVTSQVALTLLCMLVLLTAAAAKLWSYWSLARVTCHVRVDKARMFPDETLRVEAQLDNNKFLPIWLQVQIPIVDALGAAASRARTLAGAASLLSHQRARLQWQVSQLPRGVHRVGVATVTASDPLGFFPRSKPAAACEIIVYPRLVPLRPMVLPRRDWFGRPGAYGPVEDPLYTHGVRDYYGARAARHIHWKSTARMHRLVEKLFEQSAQPRVLLMLRVQGFEEDASGQAFERALEVLASLAVALERERIPVGLATDCALHAADTGVTRIRRGPGQLAQLLTTLARAQPRQAGDLERLLSQACSAATLTTLLVCGYAADTSEPPQTRRYASVRSIRIVCDPQLCAADLPRASGAQVCRLGDLHAGA